MIRYLKEFGEFKKLVTRMPVFIMLCVTAFVFLLTLLSHCRD